MKLIAFLIALTFSSSAFCQLQDFEAVPEASEENQKKLADPNPFNFGIKLVPLAILDLSMGTFQVGAEVKLKDYRSLNLDIGYRPNIDGLDPSERTETSGVKARLQYRRYSRSPAFRGFYAGLEGFYKYQVFDMDVVFGHGCNTTNNGEVFCNYYEFTDIRVQQHASAAGILLGLQPLARSKDRVRNRIIFDVSASLGMRWIREYYPERPEDVEVYNLESSIDGYRDFREPSDVVYPNVGFNIRIGWWIS